MVAGGERSSRTSIALASPRYSPPTRWSTPLSSPPRDVLTVLFNRVGDIGLEIAPGNEVEDLSIIEDVGNIWNHVRREGWAIRAGSLEGRWQAEGAAAAAGQELPPHSNHLLKSWALLGLPCAAAVYASPLCAVPGRCPWLASGTRLTPRRGRSR